MNDFSILSKIRRLLVDPSIEVDMVGFVFAIAVSMLAAAIISWLYQAFYENRATGAQIHRSFLLISPSVTSIFIAIQFSLPLSLGLLGALSIVRFRTPIKEPEEIGFIMLLIAASVVCATFQFTLLIALLALVLVGLLAQRYVPSLLRSKRQDGLLVLTIPASVSDDARARLTALLEARLHHGQLQSVTYTEEQGVLQYSFAGSRAGSLDGLRGAVAEIVPVQRLNVFFNKQGSLF